MNTDAHAAPTLEHLRAVLTEVNAGMNELCEMLQVDGPVSAMWDKPRNYFTAEAETFLPFTNDRLDRLIDPIWQTEFPAGSEAQTLSSEIVLNLQLFELIRREIIPERFAKWNPPRDAPPGAR